MRLVGREVRNSWWERELGERADEREKESWGRELRVEWHKVAGTWQARGNVQLALGRIQRTSRSHTRCIGPRRDQ